MFRELSLEYGYTYYDTEEEAYDWVDVPHTFSSPMYYVSYGTSALAALDIWTIALEDRQAGIDKYMELTTYGLTTTYCELLEKCGLKSIFEEGTIQEIAQAVSDYSSALAHGGDVEDTPHDGREEYENYDLDSFMEKYGSDLDTDIFDNVSSFVSSFIEMHTFILLGAEVLTVITLLIIIGILSSKEKKR